MISRVAESCFWLNRYVERVEVLSRILNVNISFQLDVGVREAERWRPLVVVTGQAEDFAKQTPERDRDDAEVVLAYLTWDERNPASVISALRMARENARTIRETISLEMWEALNDVWVWLGERASRRLYESEPHAFYQKLCNQCLLFHGLAQATMLHEDPFEFMRLGTALERASQTARILDIKYHSIGPTRAAEESPAEAAQWMATLRFCSGFEPFFKNGDRTLNGRSVAEFLIFERTFPRSIQHNLARVRNFLKLVRPGEDSPIGMATDRMLSALLADMGERNIDAILDESLHDYLTHLVKGTLEIGSSIHRDFFDPAISEE